MRYRLPQSHWGTWASIWAVLLARNVTWAAAAISQAQGNRGAATVLAGMLMVIALVVLAISYVYIAVCVQTIAKKTKVQNPWLAWIPIANLILMLNIARKPLWWLVLLLIPAVNLVFIVLVWVEIAKACGKPGWWGILMIVPVANLIAPAYLAFSD